MKKSIALLFAAITLFGAGCCTTPQPSAWEYRDIFIAKPDTFDKWSKDGWVFVNAYYDTENKTTCYLVKRLKK